MKKTKVIKLDLVTYERVLKMGKPYSYGDTINTILIRLLDKLEPFSKPSKPKRK